MNATRVIALGVALVWFAPWWRSESWSEARAETIGAVSAARVLVGELVVTNAAGNQFHLVGQRGFFTAPAGISVEALSGKPVEVELGPQGRVVRITPKAITYAPITDGQEIISGELVTQDPALRSFAIAGDDRRFVAPARYDLGQYAGRIVEVRIDDHGQVRSIDLTAKQRP